MMRATALTGTKRTTRRRKRAGWIRLLVMHSSRAIVLVPIAVIALNSFLLRPVRERRSQLRSWLHDGELQLRPWPDLGTE